MLTKSIIFFFHRPFFSRMKATMNDFQQRHTWVQRLLSWLLSIWVLHLVPSVKKAAAMVK